jgi:glucose/arabinose dehydrogenase
VRRAVAAVAAAAAAVVLAAAAAGCGSDAGDGNRSAGGDTPAPSATVPESTAASPPTTPSTSSVSTSSPPAPSTSTTAAPEPGAVQAVLTPVAELDRPTALRARQGTDSLYVAERIGRLQRLDPIAGGGFEVAAEPVLDMSDRVGAGGEGGFLGFAFSPDDGHLYVSYTTPDLDSRVDEYAVDGDDVDEASRREVLAVDQPFPNHKGGDLHFGPDGFLWLGLGDGGGGGDPNENAQDTGVLLGKLLRIDPAAAGGEPYAVPAGNPFVGVDGARPEVWAYGLRNPWRFSFDRETGDLWIADVGQGDIEEIDFVAAGTGAGTNFGWDLVEGTRSYEGSPPPGAVPPVFEYTHDEGGCAVAGGVVYRGSALPDLEGAYLFGDYCDARVRALVVDGGQVADDVDLGLDVPGGQLVSFGEDAAGEVYVLSLGGSVSRLDPAP